VVGAEEIKADNVMKTSQQISEWITNKYHDLDCLYDETCKGLIICDLTELTSNMALLDELENFINEP
jgi:hypothetical protein